MQIFQQLWPNTSGKDVTGSRTWTGVGRGSRLWLRSLSSTTARPLAGTEGATSPFWSPDSRSVAFMAGGALKRPVFPVTWPVTRLWPNTALWSAP